MSREIINHIVRYIDNNKDTDYYCDMELPIEKIGGLVCDVMIKVRRDELLFIAQSKNLTNGRGGKKNYITHTLATTDEQTLTESEVVSGLVLMK
jgi:hypothetical protein